MLNQILDLYDIVRYNLLGFAAPERLPFDPNLSFKLHKEKHGYWVTADALPGYIASGKDLQELRDAMWDTLLTYYDIPRYRAKRIADKFILNLSDGTLVTPREDIISVKVELA